MKQLFHINNFITKVRDSKHYYYCHHFIVFYIVFILTLFTLSV
jgi:hypothetical protein